SHGCNAATAFAVGVSSELARGDFRLEVGRDDARGSREYAFRGITWRRLNFTDEFFRHFQNRVLHPQMTEIGNNRSALRNAEDFGIGGAALWSEDAEPY